VQEFKTAKVAARDPHSHQPGIAPLLEFPRKRWRAGLDPDNTGGNGPRRKQAAPDGFIERGFAHAAPFIIAT